MFAGRMKVVSHSSCRTSAIFKYFCPLNVNISEVNLSNVVLEKNKPGMYRKHNCGQVLIT